MPPNIYPDKLPTGLPAECQGRWLEDRHRDAKEYGIDGVNDDGRNHARMRSTKLLLEWLSQNPADEPIPGRKQAILWLKEIHRGRHFLAKHQKLASDILSCYANNKFADANAMRRKDQAATSATAYLPPGLEAYGVLPGTELAMLLNGIDLSITGRKTWLVASGTNVKRANVYGNNGITLGQWYPRAVFAYIHGAHGVREAGIYGSNDGGTYSIIISRLYEGADQDNGDTVWYSGPKALNSQPSNTPDRHAAYLKTSFRTRCPVRVLRKGGDMGPSCGIRYDGLYTVDQHRECVNGHGHKYDQFHLTRSPGQTDLDEIRRASPTKKECRLYREIKRLQANFS